jgi:hypothetical protein
MGWQTIRALDRSRKGGEAIQTIPDAHPGETGALSGVSCGPAAACTPLRTSSTIPPENEVASRRELVTRRQGAM